PPPCSSPPPPSALKRVPVSSTARSSTHRTGEFAVPGSARDAYFDTPRPGRPRRYRGPASARPRARNCAGARSLASARPCDGRHTRLLRPPPTPPVPRLPRAATLPPSPLAPSTLRRTSRWLALVPTCHALTT
ncbi:hypothetical protein K523DRAFT_258016, partial [Schizophyllum commune Tattone D]